MDEQTANINDNLQQAIGDYNTDDEIELGIKKKPNMLEI